MLYIECENLYFVCRVWECTCPSISLHPLHTTGWRSRWARRWKVQISAGVWLQGHVPPHVCTNGFYLLKSVAVCSSVLQYVAVWKYAGVWLLCLWLHMYLQMRCSVLPYVVVCCSVLKIQVPQGVWLQGYVHVDVYCISYFILLPVSPCLTVPVAVSVSFFVAGCSL